MAKNKELRKALKGPDAFQTTVASGLEKAMQYKGIIGVVIGAVILSTVGIAFYQHYSNVQTKERVNELGKIEEVYQKENEALSKQRDVLREQLGKLTQPSEDGNPPKLTAAQEKEQSELQNRLAVMVADHSRTLARYQEFFAAHKPHPEGWMAGMRAAGILIDQKKFEEAKQILAEILSVSDDSFFYQINGRMIYINVLDELDDFDTALGEIEKLTAELSRIDRLSKSANEARKSEMKVEARNPAEDLVPQALLTKGRLLLRKGDKDAAATVFDKIMNEHEDSVEARQAMSFKALLL